MKEIKLFFNSFKLDRDFIYIFLVELIFLLIIVGAAFGWIGILNAKSVAVTNSFSTLSGGDDLLGLNSLVSHFKVFFFFFVMLTTAFVLILLFGFSLARNLVWNRLFNKSFKLKKYLKFTLLNFVWFIVWLPLIIIFMFPLFTLSSAFQTNPGVGILYSIMVYANLILFLIMAYFGMFAYQSFLHHKRIYRALTESLKHGVKTLPKLFLPIVLVLVSLLILWGLSAILPALLIAILLLYLFTSARKYVISKLI
ncbi:hypothetical protein HN592_04025 [Candidatus Woesearchaeota archaeon]|jgi:hypothetical protein|nr:hypothetical protein [Candidatus Woesearchaeota archaeon]MBT4368379.1 hypothetical protein [Candidatus Woesearchaeota archaeon]MBT4712868.1 hypothetical protein [Candidatus Woesearchaeota archaeon]MBT6639780.1 hypothetical protein [Candidatus Woesearchaeota archaeon]MBT7133952.1 hypothetical protein [Candidatus Woesearchaeota archaeon]